MLTPLWRTKEHRRLALVVVVACGVRLAWVAYVARTPVGGDPGSYLYYGEQIARGKGYVSFVTDAPTAFYPVGYPAALAAVFFVVIHTPIPNDLPMAAGLLNVVLAGATVVLTYEVARRLVGTRVALTAAILQALWPGLVFQTGAILTETLFNFTVMASLLAILVGPWPEGRVGRSRLLAFGALLGVAASVRPFCLLFLPMLVVAWLVAGAGWRRSLSQLAWSLLALAVVLTPWTVRNIIRMDAPLVFSSNLGDTLCISRAVGASGAFQYCRSDLENRVRLEDVDPADFELKQASENTRQALQFVRRHPDDELRLIGWRAFYAYQNDEEALAAVESFGLDPFIPDRTRAVLGVMANGYFFAMLALGLLGLPGFVRRRRAHPERLFFVLAMAALGSVPLFLYGLPRFHVPALPLVSVVAAVPVAAAIPGRRRLDGETRAAAGAP